MKRYNLGDLVAASMEETLNSDEFKKIFAKPGPAVVVKTTAVNPNLDAFNSFAERADKKDDDKKDKKSKKDEKPKKGKMPPWLQKGKKKKKDDDKDDEDEEKCPECDKKKSECTCSEKKAFVSFAKDDKDKEKEAKEKAKAKEEKAKEKAEAKEEKEKAKEEKKKEKEEAKKAKKKEAMLALHYIVDSLSKTSAVLDEMGYERSSMAALQALDIIVREASIKTAHDEEEGGEFEDEDLERELDKDLFGPEQRSELGLPEDVDEPDEYPDLRPEEERTHGEFELEPHEELNFDANDADAPVPPAAPAKKPAPVKPAGKPVGKPAGKPQAVPAQPPAYTGPQMPDRKPNAPFMHQVPGVAGKPAAPAGKPAPAWNRPKMAPTEINMSDDDYVSPNELKSSIDPKLNESGEGHVKHDHHDVNDAQVVQAFNSLDKWVKNGDDIDTL